MAKGKPAVRVRTTIKDVDKGYVDLMKRINASKSASVEVGIMAGKGDAPKGAMTVLEVATIHEFGLGGMPERSFIRGWFDVYQDVARKQISAMLKSVVQGKRSKAQAMELLGVRWVAEIQKFIAVGTNLQPLERATILRKGSSVPLVDTGQLKSAITYRVNVSGGAP